MTSYGTIDNTDYNMILDLVAENPNWEWTETTYTWTAEPFTRAGWEHKQTGLFVEIEGGKWYPAIFDGYPDLFCDSEYCAEAEECDCDFSNWEIGYLKVSGAEADAIYTESGTGNVKLGEILTLIKAQDGIKVELAPLFAELIADELKAANWMDRYVSYDWYGDVDEESGLLYGDYKEDKFLKVSGNTVEFRGAWEEWVSQKDWTAGEGLEELLEFIGSKAY